MLLHSNLNSGSKVQLSDCSADGKEMIKILNDYRQENGLPAIEKSCSLCTVANTKVDGTIVFENSIAKDSHFSFQRLNLSMALELGPGTVGLVRLPATLTLRRILTACGRSPPR